MGLISNRTGSKSSLFFWMMSRSFAWRRVCPDNVKQRIDEALEARFYILRETGPTGFLVKQDSRDTKLKVFLGDPNSCTCGAFIKDKELCIHILWVLLRKFRISKDNPLIFQKALVEREINELIRGIHVRVRDEKKADTTSTADDEKGKMKAKSIDEDDVCPICQEEILGCKEPLTHCRFGCGNNIHIKCMKVWAQHRKSDGESIVKCPLCRSDFGSYQDIIQEFHSLSSKKRKKFETNDLHIGATCQSCRVSPIQGNCYRCVICLDYHLCQSCFATKNHSQHSFQFRKNTNKRWRPASRTYDAGLPVGIMDNLQNRELTNEDYDLLLQLDRPVDASAGHLSVNSLSLDVLGSSSFAIRNKENCQMCRRMFNISQCVRRLACSHTFHKDCIDQWISNGHSTCPLDGLRIEAKAQSKSRDGASGNDRAITSENTSQSELAILGVNSTLQRGLTNSQMRQSRINRKERKSFSSVVEGLENGLSDLSINGYQTRTTDRHQGQDVLSTTTTVALEPLVQTRDLNHNESSRTRRGLPPIHPGKAQSRSRSGDQARRHNNASHFGTSSDGSSLRVGATPSRPGAERTNQGNKIQPRSTKGNLLKKRLSAGPNSLSSSEPNLRSLSDVFQVSGLASRFSDSDAKS